MEKYTEYISKLSWNKPKAEQKEAALFLSQVEDWDYKNCITSSNKDVWEELVQVISKRKKEEIKEMLPDLLFLLKDLNWPGALKAFEIVGSLKYEEIKADFWIILEKAYTEKDDMWIENLKRLGNRLNQESE